MVNFSSTNGCNQAWRERYFKFIFFDKLLIGCPETRCRLVSTFHWGDCLGNPCGLNINYKLVHRNKSFLLLRSTAFFRRHSTWNNHHHHLPSMNRCTQNNVVALVAEVGVISAISLVVYGRAFGNNLLKYCPLFYPGLHQAQIITITQEFT